MAIQVEFKTSGKRATRLLSVKVEMEVEDGLDEDDVEQNMILPCVDTPVSDIILEA